MAGYARKAATETPRVEYARPGANFSGRPHPADAVIERLAWLMDNSIPIGGGYRIGLDPIIGLIPGLGDLIGALVSSMIVLQAQRAGIPRSTLMRMVANVGIDAAIGTVPFVGDALDFAFKANQKNLELYRQSRAGLRNPRRDTLFLAVLFVALGVIAAIPIIGIFLLLRSFL